MRIEKEIYSPLILTVPDDAALFSVLNPSKKITKKIIMENNINFYCYKDLVSGIAFFRFKDSMNYGCIEGLKRCCIPIDIVKKYHDLIDLITKILMEGYCIIMPVNKGSIDFYGKNVEGTHQVFIYGIDTQRQILLCKDFEANCFVKFEVSFEEVENSLKDYDFINIQESDGIMAFQINESILPVIEYSRVYSEFYRFNQEFVSNEASCGLGAIELYLSEIKRYPSDYNLIMSWYVLANYLRESAKLMMIRFNILKEENTDEQNIELFNNQILVKKLLKDTDILFFKICRLRNKMVIVDDGITNNLCSLVNMCKDDFRMLAIYFCKLLISIVNK